MFQLSKNIHKSIASGRWRRKTASFPPVFRLFLQWRHRRKSEEKCFRRKKTLKTLFFLVFLYSECIFWRKRTKARQKKKLFKKREKRHQTRLVTTNNFQDYFFSFLWVFLYHTDFFFALFWKEKLRWMRINTEGFRNSGERMDEEK